MFVSGEELDIGKIADSGQCFRMNKIAPGRWFAMAGSAALDIRTVCGGYSLSCTEEEFKAFWKSYFDLDTDYAAFRKAVDPSDIFLMKASEAGRGIRILRQDPWEMLISFIISQRKNIPAIKSSVEALCRQFGEPLGFGIYAFPTAESLDWAGEEGLRECSLGYRAPYVARAARAVASGEVDLKSFEDLSDDGLLHALMKLYGVGVKVANCVSLFGYHRIGAFPVDVWINRVIDCCYGGSFPLARYEEFAGVIQQYIFYYARTFGDDFLSEKK